MKKIYNKFLLLSQELTCSKNHKNGKNWRLIKIETWNLKGIYGMSYNEILISPSSFFQKNSKVMIPMTFIFVLLNGHFSKTLNI